MNCTCYTKDFKTGPFTDPFSVTVMHPSFGNQSGSVEGLIIQLETCKNVPVTGAYQAEFFLSLAIMRNGGFIIPAADA